MEILSNVGLISTLHDPEGRMAATLAASLPALQDLYAFMAVVATTVTAPETWRLLEEAGETVLRNGTRAIGANRRQAMAQALRSQTGSHLHYCDFDRLLYWHSHFSEELAEVVRRHIPGNDFLALGRTPAAFESHPPVQKALESLTNRVFGHVFGREMDVVAGSCGLSRAGAEVILQHSREPSNATDTEWPMIIDRLAPGMQVSYLTVEGLAFETAMFYGPEVFAASDTVENWASRTQLARDSIEAALRLSVSKS